MKPKKEGDDVVVSAPPQLFIHVRVAVYGRDIQGLEQLRNQLIAMAEQLTPNYAIRIKRRKITREQAQQLRATYEARAARQM